MKKTNKLSGEDRRRQGLCWIALFIALFFFVFTACDEDKDETDKDIAVSFNSLSADGSSTQTTTALTLTFSQAINGLSASDISLSGVAKVSNGSLSGSGPTYTLNIGGFISGGSLTVKVAKSGYNISNSQRNVTIYYKVGADIMTLPPMKKQFPADEYFLIGNIFNPSDATSETSLNPTLKRHFNVLTPENNMKPDKLISAATSSSVTWNDNNKTIADRMVKAAEASSIEVVGHTLLWHNQNYAWMTQLPAHNNDTTTKNNNIAIMKKYISEVLGDSIFKGKIYSWDVLNEAFPDNVSASADWKTAIRSNNPWFKAIGSDFVYEAYLAARHADPAAILYYNDYNLDQPGKAEMVKKMVADVNQKYVSESNKPAGEATGRLLIEGIGMQSHHNTGVSANSIKTTLNLFKNNLTGIKISISELDVLGSGYSSSLDTGPNRHNNSPINAQGLATQARLYGEYMALFIEFKDIIERVTLWGVRDSQSWRSAGLPLLFDANGKAKEAYYKFVEKGEDVESEPPHDDNNPTLYAINLENGSGVTITGNSVTFNTASATSHGFYYDFPQAVKNGTFTDITVTFKVTSYTKGNVKFVAKKTKDFATDLVGSSAQYIDIGTANNLTKTVSYPLSACDPEGFIVFQHNSHNSAANDNIDVNYTVELTFRFTE